MYDHHIYPDHLSLPGNVIFWFLFGFIGARYEAPRLLLNNNNAFTIIFTHPVHLSHPGQVMFLARSQWKHLRASTEVEERMEANTTVTETSPNIFSTSGDSSPCSLLRVLSSCVLHSSLITWHTCFSHFNHWWQFVRVSEKCRRGECHKQQIVKTRQVVVKSVQEGGVWETGNCQK